MSSPRVRRSRRVWRAIRLASVSLGIAAGGCLLSKVEFDGPPTQQDVNDLAGSGGTSGTSGTGSEAADGGPDDSAQGGTGTTPRAGEVGTICVNNRACESLSCSDGRCAAATCDDQIINQDETDRDCGGVCPRRCGAEEGCLDDDDCDPTLFCAPATRRCTASCNDRELNGAELLVDCGGGVCPGCPDGTACSQGSDCVSLVCSSSGCDVEGTMCCAPARCDDGVTNASESDTDCGGTCARCNDGYACVQASDCVNDNCNSGFCISCGDGIRNGSETSADCGGFDPACRRCDAGAGCQQDSDCVDQLCVRGRCCGSENCAACVERLSPTLNCNAAPPGSTLACSAFLDCLTQNPDVCLTRNAPGCSDAGGVCDADAYGGNAGPALTFVTQMFADASCAQ